MLSLSCPYKIMDEETGANNGCSVIKTLPSMKAHMEQCKFGVSPCIYAQQGCSAKIKNSEMAAHIPICGKRPLDCKFRFNGCDWLDKPAEEVADHQLICLWDSVLGKNAPGQLGIPIMSSRGRLQNRTCRFRKIMVLEFSFTIAVTGYEFKKITEFLETEIFRLMMYNDNMVMRSATEYECLEALWKASENSGVPLKGESPNHTARRDAAAMENLSIEDLLSESLEEEEMDQLEQQPSMAGRAPGSPNIVTIEPNDDMAQNEIPGLPTNTVQDEEEPVRHDLTPEDRAGTAESSRDEGPAESTEANGRDESSGGIEQHEAADLSGPGSPSARMESEDASEQAEIFSIQDGPAVEPAEIPPELAIQDFRMIETQQQMTDFMKEQGNLYNSISMADMYATNYARLIGNPAGQEEWRQRELDRLTANKDCRRENLDDCIICAETSSPIFPTGRKGRHLHISTRLRHLEESSNPRCNACYEDRHPIRSEFRRKLILTSSSLSNCLTEGRSSFPNYGGLQRHTDVIAVHGGKIEDLCHAAWIELKDSNEPTDICLYGGTNDILNMQASRLEDGSYEADKDGMKGIFRALAALTAFLVNGGQKHTLRCCLISRPPMIFHQGMAKRRVWKEVCMALRATNSVWEEKWGVPHSKQLDFQEFGVIKKRGLPEQFNENLYKAYRERERNKKLHLSGPYKLGYALKIVRVLGVRTVPENFRI